MGSASSKQEEGKDADSNNPDNKQLAHEGWDSLSEKKRGCTDCLCLILLIVAWFCMSVVGFIACGVVKDPNLPPGNPLRLTSSVDYTNRVCGYDPGVKSKPYGYYLMDQTSVCVSSCPTSDNFFKFICHYDVQRTANTNYTLGLQYLLQQKCMVQVATNLEFKRCVPTQAINLASKVFNSTANSGSYHAVTTTGTSWFNTFFADLFKLQGIIFGFGIGVATAVGFGYLYFLRIPGILFSMIWGIILSIQVLLLVGSWLLWSLANTWAHDGMHNKGEVVAAWVLAYIGMAATVLYFCLILVLRSRVQLALGVVKEAAKALAAMPMLIFTPIFQVIAVTLFLVPWVIYVLYLASSGKMVTHTITTSNALGMKTTTSTRTFEYTENTKYAFLYMLFCWFWSSEFIVACGQIIIALALADWYFTRDKSTIGNSTVLWALKTTFRYHLGTAAFGSLIIAIIKTIRAVIAYLQKKAKQSKNKIAEYLLCCCQCCMWCVEKCMKFLNKNAYIQTAIYGYSFCKAARTAFFLILRNILRVAAVNMVAEFVLFLGKLFVPTVTVFIAYLVVAYGTPSNEVNGIVTPLIFIAILSYFISAMFSEIFGMGIETILCCYVADEEMFPPEKRFADGGLKSTLQKTAEEAAKKNAKIAPTDQAPAPATASGAATLV